jgi:hypothetical protein
VPPQLFFGGWGGSTQLWFSEFRNPTLTRTLEGLQWSRKLIYSNSWPLIPGCRRGSSLDFKCAITDWAVQTKFNHLGTKKVDCQKTPVPIYYIQISFAKRYLHPIICTEGERLYRSSCGHSGPSEAYWKRHRFLPALDALWTRYMNTRLERKQTAQARQDSYRTCSENPY